MPSQPPHQACAHTYAMTRLQAALSTFSPSSNSTPSSSSAPPFFPCTQDTTVLHAHAHAWPPPLSPLPLPSRACLGACKTCSQHPQPGRDTPTPISRWYLQHLPPQPLQQAQGHDPPPVSPPPSAHRHVQDLSNDADMDAFMASNADVTCADGKVYKEDPNPLTPKVTGLSPEEMEAKYMQIYSK